MISWLRYKMTVAQSHARGTRAIEANLLHGIASAQRGMAERRDLSYMLPGMYFPALIIVGAEDTLTPVAEAERLRNGIRGARLHVIEGAGHLPNLERPEELNTALCEFIESLK
jgi:pimeloyl-ACP methyl ester carboxylesterase